MNFRLQKKTAQDVSINDPIETDKDGNALTLMDVIAVDDTIINDIDLKIKTENLAKYIDEVLSPRERIIIKFRYGLDGVRQLTQREVAARLGISRSYVSRIEKKSLLLLRKKFENKK